MTDLMRDLGADAWVLLFTFACGDGLDVSSGEPVAVVTDGAGSPVIHVRLRDDVLDRLEAEGLIEHHGDTARPTQRGRYYVRKWVTKTFKGEKRAAAPGRGAGEGLNDGRRLDTAEDRPRR